MEIQVGIRFSSRIRSKIRAPEAKTLGIFGCIEQNEAVSEIYVSRNEVILSLNDINEIRRHF